MDDRKIIRPDDWTIKIQKIFAELTQRTNFGYTQTGNADYGFPLMKGKIEQQVAVLIESQKTPVAILDIGTGDGSCIYHLAQKFGDKVVVVGISASDIREITTKQRELKTLDGSNFKGKLQPGEDEFLKMMMENRIRVLEKELSDCPTACYAVHNCEMLFDPTDSLQDVFSIQPGKFDLIVSSTTFMHLIDPAGALQQAYVALKDNGELFVDRFTLEGLHSEDDAQKRGKMTASKIDYHKALVEYLKQKGYAVEATYYQGTGAVEAIQCIHLIKTKSILDLPLIYTNDLGVYQPNAELQKIYMLYKSKGSESTMSSTARFQALLGKTGVSDTQQAKIEHSEASTHEKTEELKPRTTKAENLLLTEMDTVKFADQDKLKRFT